MNRHIGHFLMFFGSTAGHFFAINLVIVNRWGYTYSVFFDGNAFHGASDSASLSPPSLAINSSGCSSFSTTVDGVLTALVNSTNVHGVAITNVVWGSFSLSHDADASEVSDGLSLLPSVDSPMLAYRGVVDEQNGNSWTMSFSSNEGAVAELVCITEDGFEGSCKVKQKPEIRCNVHASRYGLTMRFGIA